MRLLERRSDWKIVLIDVPPDKIPPYAILSHTWGDDEVTFRDMPDGVDNKLGYEKLWFCANQVARDGLRYFWVDTCCIDKSSSAELQEAINSMFRWYANAVKCYVYLSDVSSASLESVDGSNRLPFESAFRRSRWFTRGWTLQELLAPATVEFFSKNGGRLGDKKSLERLICEITGIPKTALRGTPLYQYTANERFLWARKRNTSREEDWAYSLLGIFDVFMPLIYGEGKDRAVSRLRKEFYESCKMKTLDVQSRSQFAFAFSPHGCQLASSSVAGQGDAIKLWDVASGTPLQVFEGHREAIFALSFSPNGKTLLSASSRTSGGGSPGTSKLWDVISGGVLYVNFDTGPGPGRDVRFLFSPDSKFLVTAVGMAGVWPHTSIKLWDTCSSTSPESLAASPSHYPGAMAFSPDGKQLYLALIDDEGRIAIQDVLSNTPLHALSGPPGGEPSITFSPNGQKLLQLSNGGMSIWDVVSGTEVHTIRSPVDYWHLAFSPDSKWLVKVGETLPEPPGATRILIQTTVEMLDASSGTVLYTRKVPTGDFKAFAFSGDSTQMVLTVWSENMLRVMLCDVITGSRLHTLVEPSVAVHNVAFSPDGKHLLLCSEGRQGLRLCPIGYLTSF